MKKATKKIAIILSVILIFWIAIGIWFNFLPPFGNVRDFSIDEYSEILPKDVKAENESGNVYLGEDLTAFQIRQKAKKVFRLVFDDYPMGKHPPYIISYDKENDIWLVQAGLWGFAGGGAHILINGSDGRILYIWNYKF